MKQEKTEWIKESRKNNTTVSTTVNIPNEQIIVHCFLAKCY